MAQDYEAILDEAYYELPQRNLDGREFRLSRAICTLFGSKSTFDKLCSLQGFSKIIAVTSLQARLMERERLLSLFKSWKRS